MLAERVSLKTGEAVSKPLKGERRGKHRSPSASCKQGHESRLKAITEQRAAFFSLVVSRVREREREREKENDASGVS